MDNLQIPAYPQSIAFSGNDSEAQSSWGLHADFSGFTKLEKAALMIAAGFCGGQDPERQMNLKAIATTSVHLAKAVIEEANK